MLKIDGSFGEGGGQILRTALTLSCVLNKAIHIYNIRKGRPKPGLSPQHLTCVKACQRITQAQVTGNKLRSQELKFSPHHIKSGEYSFNVAEETGSAGSVSLVFQAILLPLSFANASSKVDIIGGTHVPWSPPVHYLKEVFLPTIERMGIQANVGLQKWGFYPKGGGKIDLWIEPCKKVSPLSLVRRGSLKKITITSSAANLPRSIAERQKNRGLEILTEKDIYPHCEIVEAPAMGKGTFFFILAEFENTLAGFGSLGAIGKRAEVVAEEACREFLEFLATDAAVDKRLADQLITYASLAKGKSNFTTSQITRHLLTNIWLIKQFLPVEIAVEGKEGKEGKPGKITIQGSGR